MHAHICWPRCLIPSLLSACACASALVAAGILFNRNIVSVYVHGTWFSATYQLENGGEIRILWPESAVVVCSE